MPCRVNTFSLRLDPRRDSPVGRFAPEARFSLTLESGTPQQSINIMQRRRGMRRSAGRSGFEHGPPAPRIFGGPGGGGGRTATAADIARMPQPGSALWVTDHVPSNPSRNYTWNGAQWSGVINQRWLTRARAIGQWTDTPGWRWQSAPGADQFPLYLGGPTATAGAAQGSCDFVTYVVCKTTGTVVCGIWWGVRIDYGRSDEPPIRGTRVHIWGQEAGHPGVCEARSRRSDDILGAGLPDAGSFQWDLGP